MKCFSERARHRPDERAGDSANESPDSIGAEHALDRVPGAGKPRWMATTTAGLQRGRQGVMRVAIGGVLALASWQAAGNLGGGLWHQRVTARLGDQDGWAGGVFLDLLPQPVDVCLERVSGEPGIVAPDLLQ